MKGFKHSATKLSSLLIVSAFLASFLMVISAAPASAAAVSANLYSPKPDNRENTNDSTPEFIWSTDPANTAYEVKIFTNPADQTGSQVGYMMVGENGDNPLHWEMENVLPDGLYYWDVASFQAPANWTGSNTGYQSFRIDTAAPPVPTITWPVSGDNYTNDTTPTITWDSGSENSYPVLFLCEVSATPDFASAADNSGWLTMLSSHTTGALAPNTMYYVRVSAKDNAGNVSTLNANMTVFMIDTTKPARPTITYPTENDAGVRYLPITWSAIVDNGVEYIAILDDADTFATPVDYVESTSPVYYFPDNLPNGHYFLRVAAVDAAGNYGDNTQIAFWKDNVAPLFAAEENVIIARTRDNQATKQETTLHYYYENDNIYIVVKAAEPNLFVRAQFEALGVAKENENGVALADNAMRYLITYENVQLSTENGYAIHVVLTDNAGNETYSAMSIYPFVAVMNVNPKYMAGAGLDSDNTTDWRTIKDFTNIENLTFEKMLGPIKVGRLKFLENLNLCDNVTMYALFQLGQNLDMSLASMSLNSAANALAAMNKQSELVMYNLPFTSSPGILKDGVTAVTVGNTSGSTVSGLTWDNENKILTFTVTSWSEYKADGTAPDPPVGLTATPSSWTATNSWTISWTNPSGDNIAGAYYKVGTPPTTNTDGTFKAGFNLTSFLIENMGAENSIVFVWLKDNVGNVNKDNYNAVNLYLDNVAPNMPTISSSSVTKGGSTTSTSISFSWTSVGGPSTVTYYYKLEGKESSYSTTTGTSKSYSGLAAGSYTFRLYATDVGGTSGTDNYNFTITAPLTEENENEETVEQVTGSSTPTGGYTVTVSTIPAGSSVNVVVQNVPVTGLEIAVNSSVSNVQVTIEESTTTPSGIAIAAPGETFGYLQIETQNITDEQINYVKITFKVEKATMGSTDKTTISLYRYTNGEWVRLPTQIASEDGTYVYYEATSPGLSVFVISTFAPTTMPTPTPTPTTTYTPIPTPTSGTVPAGVDWLIIVGVIVAVVIGLLAILLPKRPKA